MKLRVIHHQKMCDCKGTPPVSFPPNVHDTSFYLCIKCSPHKVTVAEGENYCHYCKKWYAVLMKRKNQDFKNSGSSLSELNLKQFIKDSSKKFPPSIQTSRVLQNACCATDDPKQEEHGTSTSIEPSIWGSECEQGVLFLSSDPNISSDVRIPNSPTELARKSILNEIKKHNPEINQNTYIDELVTNLLTSAKSSTQSKRPLHGISETVGENSDRISIEKSDVNDLVKSLIQPVIKSTNVSAHETNETIKDLATSLIISIMSTTHNSFNNTNLNDMPPLSTSSQRGSKAQGPSEISKQNSETPPISKNEPLKQYYDTGYNRQIHDEKESIPSNTSFTSRFNNFARKPKCSKTYKNHSDTDSSVSISCSQIPECSQFRKTAKSDYSISIPCQYLPDCLNYNDDSPLPIPCEYLPECSLGHGLSTSSSISVTCSELPNCYKYYLSKNQAKEPAHLHDALYQGTEIKQKSDSISNKNMSTLKKDRVLEKSSNKNSVLKTSEKFANKPMEPYKLGNSNHSSRIIIGDTASKSITNVTSGKKLIDLTGKNPTTTKKFPKKLYNDNVESETSDSERSAVCSNIPQCSKSTINRSSDNVEGETSDSERSAVCSNMRQCSKSTINRSSDNVDGETSDSERSAVCSNIPQCSKSTINRSSDNVEGETSDSERSAVCSNIPQCSKSTKNRSSDNVEGEASGSERSAVCSNIPQYSNSTKNGSTTKEQLDSDSTVSISCSYIPQCLKKMDQTFLPSASTISVSCTQNPECCIYHGSCGSSSSYLSGSCSQIPECAAADKSKSKKSDNPPPTQSFNCNEYDRKNLHKNCFTLEEVMNFLTMPDIPTKLPNRHYNVNHCLNDKENEARLRKYLKLKMHYRNESKFEGGSASTMLQYNDPYSDHVYKQPKYILDRVKPPIYPNNREWKTPKYNSISKQTTEYHHSSMPQSSKNLEYTFKNERYIITSESCRSCSVQRMKHDHKQAEYCPKMDPHLKTHANHSEYKTSKYITSNQEYKNSEYNRDGYWFSSSKQQYAPEYDRCISDFEGTHQYNQNISSKSSFTDDNVGSNYSNERVNCIHNSYYNQQKKQYLQSDSNNKNLWPYQYCSPYCNTLPSEKSNSDLECDPKPKIEKNKDLKNLSTTNQSQGNEKNKNYYILQCGNSTKNRNTYNVEGSEWSAECSNIPQCSCPDYPECSSQDTTNFPTKKLSQCIKENPNTSTLKNKKPDSDAGSSNQKNGKNIKSEHESTNVSRSFSQSNVCCQYSNCKYSVESNTCEKPIATEKYAIVRISDYKTYRTYEIMKSTSQKPKTFCDATKDIFIVKKEICGLEQRSIFPNF